MKKEISNNYLIVIAILTIALSAFSIFLSLGKLGITGWASTGEGYVNVTVPTTTAIVVHTQSINFTGTLLGETKNSYVSSQVDTRDGMPCTTDNHCGMNITNAGSDFINITILETENLFTGGSYDADTHFLYNVTMQDEQYATAYGANGNCSVGYDMGLAGVGGVGYWRGVPRTSAEVAVCYLNFTDAVPGGGNSDFRPDIARIEFNITVPLDEASGKKDGTLTFSGVAS